MSIPIEHTIDAHKLNADGKIELYELTPSIGSGVLRFKPGPDHTWLGNLYSGISMQFEGESWSSSGISPQPSLVIGQNDIDLSAFKPLIWSGGLDNARITKHELLLTHLLGNNNIKKSTVYRVKKVDGYSVSQIKLILSVFSTSGPTSLPFRQYLPPAFPFVVL